MIDIDHILAEPGGDLVVWDYCLENNLIISSYMPRWEYLGSQSGSGRTGYHRGFSVSRESNSGMTTSGVPVDYNGYIRRMSESRSGASDDSDENGENGDGCSRSDSGMYHSMY